MKKNALFTLVMFVGLSISGLSLADGKVDDKQLKQIKNSMVYFKDKHGICYSVVKMEKAFMDDTTGISHAVVPCEKVGLAD